MANDPISYTRSSWWLFAIPVVTKDQWSSLAENATFDGFVSVFARWYIYVALGLAAICSIIVCWLSCPGGAAWVGKQRRGEKHIPGPRGWPVVGSLIDMTVGLAHCNLAELARRHGATKLMAISLGSTPAVVTSDPDIARELLSSPYFADRPLKQSAKHLLFDRAIGFAPSGDYWRLLRRISSSHLFAPRRIAAHEALRQADSLKMLRAIQNESSVNGVVKLRPHLQEAALNNIMGSVFGRRFGSDSQELQELKMMVDEGFELLGAFNWADHLPWLRPLDPLRIHRRCARLVPRVRSFVKSIIDEHRRMPQRNTPSDADFVDVLLSLQGDDKLEDVDMIAVLWEMIFRGTDTTALLAEWAMAELVANEEVQSKVQAELDAVVGPHNSVRDEDIAKLPYLQSVVKETLRMHPPGPLLSWARLCIQDVHIGEDRTRIPAGTTAMVNMWSITHDPCIWDSPWKFFPERFVVSEGGQNVDVRGSDLRLAPFGAGRRVCPGKALGLATVHLWIAKLLHHFKWIAAPQHPVDFSEVLKLSCQMAKPLTATPVPRVPF